MLPDNLLYLGRVRKKSINRVSQLSAKSFRNVFTEALYIYVKSMAIYIKSIGIVNYSYFLNIYFAILRLRALSITPSITKGEAPIV